MKIESKWYDARREVVVVLASLPAFVAEDMATASKKAANAADSAAVDKALASVGEIVVGGDFERIRAVLSLLVDRVEIDGDDVEIFYAF